MTGKLLEAVPRLTSRAESQPCMQNLAELEKAGKKVKKA
jgi:hypothetical protein